jgi:hypothetical protein
MPGELTSSDRAETLYRITSERVPRLTWSGSGACSAPFADALASSTTMPCGLGIWRPVRKATLEPETAPRGERFLRKELGWQAIRKPPTGASPGHNPDDRGWLMTNHSESAQWQVFPVVRRYDLWECLP